MTKQIQKLNTPKMKILVQAFQFFPLAIFMVVARKGNFESSAWQSAFEWGALAALIETVIIFAVLKARPSLMITAVNVFLIIGGIGFYFNNQTLLMGLDHLRATGLVISVAVITVISIIASKNKLNSRSYIFLGSVILTIGFSYMNRTDVLMSGVLPFIFLIITEKILYKKQAL